MSNMNESNQVAADLFKVLAHPVRLTILSILRDGEQCVCHIEAMLNLRQAYISQHLKILKDANIVSVRRDGWNMYYRIIYPGIFEVIDAMYSLTGFPEPVQHRHGDSNCPCPKCNSESDIFVLEQRIVSSK